MMSIASIACDAPQKTTNPDIPDTLAGIKFTAWLNAFNTGNAETIKSFVESHYAESALQEMTGDERTAWDVMIYNDNRGVEFRRLVDSTEHEIAVLTQAKLTEMWLRVSINVEPQSPHGITNFRIMFVPPPSDIAWQRKVSDAEMRKDIEEYIAKLTEADSFSGAVLVAKNGQPIFTHAGGMAEKNASRPNRVDTRFNLASMSKMFTSVAIAQLAQEGKLKFTDKLGKHLPDHPNKQVADSVTIHHLLTHTSGTGMYWNADYETAKNRIKTTDDFLIIFVNDPLAFEPGKRFQYSNNGYILLGAIIEKVSGQSYYDYLRKSVFKPAGMTNTDFYEKNQSVPNLAFGYTNMNADGRLALGGRRSNEPILGAKGSSAGGGYSTVEDLLRFDVALRRHKLLNETYTNTVLTGKVQGDEGMYAYGFVDEKVNGQCIVGHSGGFPGISTRLEMYLNNGYTVVILTNYDSVAMPAISHRLREMLTAE